MAIITSPRRPAGGLGVKGATPPCARFLEEKGVSALCQQSWRVLAAAHAEPPAP